ncbi:MAG: hypothetical protein ACD_10C00106G0001 [uncultured bacterium]|nr:MAG: hypothetical protein ACD_10C00106G0001 [uncultured bacterium]
MRQIDHVDIFLNTGTPLSGRQVLAHLIDRQRHVLANGHPGHQRIALENHAAIRPWAGNFLAFEQDLAAIRGNQSGDQRNQGRLSAPRKADDRHKLAFANLEIDVFQYRRLMRSGAVGLGNIGQIKKCRSNIRLGFESQIQFCKLHDDLLD